jgi:hypothetical protein
MAYISTCESFKNKENKSRRAAGKENNLKNIAIVYKAPISVYTVNNKIERDTKKEETGIIKRKQLCF